MNFVAQLEECLRDLGVEARRKHPGVNEASERAISKLRTLQNAYASAVRKSAADGEKHPDKTLFRSSDLLHPFLLAANYPNASPRLLDTSFKAMKILMEANAVCPGDGMNLVRVWMIQAQVVVSYSSKESSINGGISRAAVDPNDSSGNSSSTKQSSGSWLGSFLYSSAESSGSKITNAVSTKTAVSSSHGQAGSGHLNAKDLEKLALDILSCLLQLLELRDLPVTAEQWTQSVTLCCLLCLPLRQNVRQAAHSTLPQVLTLLVNDDKNKDLALSTWNDLLTCSLRFSSHKPAEKGKASSLHGAFSHCRLGEKDAAQPPSQPLSLDLMTTMLKEAPYVFSKVGPKTLGVVVQVLQMHCNSPDVAPGDYLRVLQFALVVIQTQEQEWRIECRELVAHLIKPIVMATDSIRKQADFEDGFSYTTTNDSITPATNLDTIRALPPCLLWKAALSIETVKSLVLDKSLIAMWMHPDVIVQLLESMSDFCTIGASCREHINLLVVSSRQNEKTLSHNAEALTSEDSWRTGKHNDGSYVLGDALWVGFGAIVKMIESLEEGVLEAAFAPSLAVLQHYLKRLPGCAAVVKRSLDGYFALAKVSMNTGLLRRALLTSLCKLSLPRWGTHDPSCLLRDQNVAALICVLNIIHRYYASIQTEWYIVMQTFQELSVLAIASPYLSNDAYVGALSISAVYSRFASFSTCFPDNCLKDFVEGLREVSVLDQQSSGNKTPMRGIEALKLTQKQSDDNQKSEKETISEKIMNIGVRAIYGTEEAHIEQEDVPLAERTKNTFSHDYQLEFSRRLANSKHRVRYDQVHFSPLLLCDVAIANIFRHGRVGMTFSSEIATLAAKSPPLRLFAMDSIAMLVMLLIEDGDNASMSFKGPGKIMYDNPRQNQFLAVETIQDGSSVHRFSSQVDLLKPLCDCIRHAKVANVAEAGAEALHSILENCGHKLNSEAWTHIVQAIASLPTEGRDSSHWANSCAVGFRCLKLIVDDFLEHTDVFTPVRAPLLDCCSSFGSSRHDLNVSLTAIGILWTIADQDAGAPAIDHALSKLVILSSDTRSEVRNCAVNTLFSCIIGRGQAFTDDQWEACMFGMVFRVYDDVTSTIGAGAGPEPAANGSGTQKARYQLSVHHSRDSTGKQWMATQSLVLQGLCRVLRIFFVRLLFSTDDSSQAESKQGETPWFDGAWSRILGFAFEAATQSGGRDTLDLRLAGVDLLVLCNQVASINGIQAATSPARVGTNMEVVNGALRSVRTPDKSGEAKQVPVRSHSAVAEMWRENLFLDAFDVLDSFREHLSNVSEDGPDAASNSTQVQVLSKFAGDLNKLYDCCRDKEFGEALALDTTTKIRRFLDKEISSADEEEPLVARFVRLVLTVIASSSSGPDSAFLSQAQRSCIELLRSMASYGSPEALIRLTSLAGPALFCEQGGGKSCKGISIVSQEASSVVTGEIQNAVHKCRVLVLCRTLDVLIDELDPEKKQGSVPPSFKLLVPLMREGMNSSRVIEKDNSTSTGGAETMLLDYLWTIACSILKRVLSPNATSLTQNISIPHASDLALLVKFSSENVASQYSSELSGVLLSGVSVCLEIAKLSGKASEGNVTENRDDGSFELFRACIAGAFHLKPKDKKLHELVRMILSSAANVTEATKNEDLSQDPTVKAAVLVCEELLNASDIDCIAISVFPELCSLVAVEYFNLRKVVGGVLAKVQVAKLLQDAVSRCSRAEARADIAESKVSALTNEIETLRKEKLALERQLAFI